MSPKRKENKFRDQTSGSLVSRTICEYLRCSQIHGYKFIMAKDRPLCERTFWAIIALTIVSLTMGLIISGYLHFVEGPTVTSEQINGFPVLKMPFPAVAICTNNRISRNALLEFSEFILNETSESSVSVGSTVSEVFKNLLSVGSLYNFDLNDDDYYKLDKSHNVLKFIYNGIYPMHKILTTLTPKCEDIIKRCKWLGRITDCRQLFSNRKTYMGNCCMFNYHRPDVEFLSHLKRNQSVQITSPLRVKKHGTDFGLTVLLDQMLDDYAFTVNSLIGIKLLIFDSQDYPDIISGSLQERLILPEEEAFITIHPILINGSNSMKHFNSESRHCVFTDEINLIYKDFYTLSECLLTCYLKNIVNLCGCFPPQYTNLFNNSECLLDDVSCLRRWKTYWNERVVHGKARPGVTYFQCPTCYSRCNIVRYRVQKSSSFFDPATVHGRWHDLNLIKGINITGHSIIYVNFGTSKIVAYEQTIQFLWYELLANFGGLSSLTFGASLMSLIELIYFATGKFGISYLTYRSKMKQRNKTNSKKQLHQLYWNELANYGLMNPIKKY